MKTEEKSEKWFAILGTECGIVSVYPYRKEAKAEIKNSDYLDKDNKIVPCIITYN